MIPFALLAGELLARDGRRLELRVVDLSPLGFTFRLARKSLPLAEAPRGFLLRFHEPKDGGEMTLLDFSLTREEENEFYTLFRVETENRDFRERARALMDAYARYAQWKLAGDGARLSKALLGYPAEGETSFAPSFAEQKREWFGAIRPDEAWADAAARIPETALLLDQPASWKRFMEREMTEFAADFLSGLAGHPVARRRITHLVIGNAFCPHLSPDDETLCGLLDKAQTQGLSCVVQIAPTPESGMERLRGRLDCLAARTGERPEIAVNDWGALRLAASMGFSVEMGVLLAKRRKDARLRFLPRGDADALSENAMNAAFFREWLEREGVRRVACEACGYPYALPGGRASLVLPFYQMNTASLCTLRAVCERGERGRQRQASACPAYCRERVFLYPEMLRMVGWGNTLFGFDREILQSGAALAAFAEQGVDRLVIGLL